MMHLLFRNVQAGQLGESIDLDWTRLISAGLGCKHAVTSWVDFRLTCLGFVAAGWDPAEWTAVPASWLTPPWVCSRGSSRHS